MNEQALMLWGVLFSSFGMGYFIYGKRQKTIVPLLCGLGLMVFPYFVSSTLPMVIIGILLMAVPYFVRF